MNTKKIEILAPAGSFETLRTAIDAGADSVFFGIADFNMRATAAANFQREDLPEVVRLCEESEVRTYLTVNTVLYSSELNKMREVVEAAKKAGVSAVIAADMATIQYCNEIGIPVHISTQLSVSNIETVKFYSQFADCIVLARELTLEQVKEIMSYVRENKITGPSGDLLKIEVFAHGAMCVAVSGRCAMSLHCYNTSANRGKCTQICRRRYKVTDLDTGQELEVDNNYVMSAADLCTIGLLPELVDSGVSVLKFEGRGRSPEYVDTVIRTYREALKAIDEDSYTEEKIKEWNKTLKTVFNRGQSTGFYMGRKYDEWALGNGSQATTERIQTGIVEKYFPKIEVAQVLLTGPEEIQNGIEFSITGEKTGLEKGSMEGMIIDGSKEKVAKKGDVITFKVSKPVRKNDKFYIIKDR